MKWHQALLSSTQKETLNKMSTMTWEERPSNIRQETIWWKKDKMKGKAIMMRERTLKENISQKMEDTPIDQFSSLSIY